MKKPLSIILCISLSLASFSQHSKISLSDDFKIAEKEYKNQTVTNSIYLGDNFYTATNSGIGGHYKWLFTKLYDIKSAVTISKFGRGMNEIKKFELEKGDKIFGPLEPQLFILGDKLCLAYFKSENKSSFDFYMSFIDQENLTLSSPQKICTILQENVGIFKLESVINSGIVHVVNSPDNSKLLVACATSQDNIQTFLLDKDLNIVKMVQPRIAAMGYRVSSIILTNENLQCLVLRSDLGTKIVCINPEGKKSEMKLLQSGTLVPYRTNAGLSKDSKSIYFCSTTTSSGAEDMRCNGLLLSQLDCGTLKLSRPLAYEFSPEFIGAISEKGGGVKSKKDFYMYNFSPNLTELDNGNIVILGSPEDESSSSSTVTSMDMNNKMQTREVAVSTLAVGPVIAFFLDKAGKTFEFAAIPRKINVSRSQQSGTGAIQMVQAPGISRTYSSFVAAAISNDIVIIYNDNEENISGDGEKIVTTKKASNLVLAEALINQDKKIQYRKQIGENLKGNYTYFLGNAITATSSSIVFPVGKEGSNFNARKMFYSNWCFVEIQ